MSLFTQAQIALLCFFLSGASSLILELVWTRELTLVFGSTTLAMSTVLSVFMGGLALGSYLAGRVADRLRDRLRAYATIEITIGLYAVVVPLLLAHYPAVNAALFHLFAERPLLLSLGRFVATAVLLILPTTLMGATLPILARHFAPDTGATGEVGKLVGTLYSVNTFGAVAGTFVAGFVLLPRLGVHVGSSRVDLQACKLEYSIVSPK